MIARAERGGHLIDAKDRKRRDISKLVGEWVVNRGTHMCVCLSLQPCVCPSSRKYEA